MCHNFLFFNAQNELGFLVIYYVLNVQHVPARGWPIRGQILHNSMGSCVKSLGAVSSAHLPTYLLSGSETSGSPNRVVGLGRRWLQTWRGRRARHRANQGRLLVSLCLAAGSLPPILLPYCFNLPCKCLIKNVVAK